MSGIGDFFRGYGAFGTIVRKSISSTYPTRGLRPLKWWLSKFSLIFCNIKQPGAKPGVVFRHFPRENIDNLLDRLSKDFSSAVSPNAFKIVFIQCKKSLIEFRETNKTSGEILELKKGLPAEYQKKYLEKYDNYTLERSSI
ncbi:hypothetical protein Ddc_18228 [Ditylenchus destructor]|nr:hypothetical protein Ddc_18228 [Ditylenchus destructor]